MKKNILSLMTLGVVAFATETTDTMVINGCKELQLTTKKSIISCPYGDYDATYEMNVNGNRYTNSNVEFVKIGEPKQQIIQYVNK